MGFFYLLLRACSKHFSGRDHKPVLVLSQIFVQRAMNSCVPDWEGHGFSGVFPSTNCKNKPLSSIEPRYVPHDVFEELSWEDGQLMSNNRPFEKQLSSWEANVPHVQVTRDHGVAPLYVGGNAANLDVAIVDNMSAHDKVIRSSPDILDDDIFTWLQYPLNTELHTDDMYSTHAVISYLPSLSLERSNGLVPCHAYALTGEVERTGVCTGSCAHSFGISLQSPKLASTAPNASHGFTPDAQSLLEEMVSPKAAWQLVNSDTPKSLRSISRLAADRKPVPSVPSYRTVVGRGECIHRRNVEECVSTNSSFESLTHPINAASVTLNQVHEAAQIKAPDAITCSDDVRSMVAGTCRIDKANTFNKNSKIDESGSYGKRKVKDSDDSESPTEDLVKQSESISTKRRRAAEIHNKSERRRRERINEKLKALEELIPNANKTDKASLLGEAIEYLKALQAQIMLLSCRTGITIPPMLMSQGMMLHSYVPPHMGMGFGAGINMNSNAWDAGVAVSAYSSMCQTPSQIAALPALPPLILPVLPLPANWKHASG